jgi:AraC-like DNA-binding protein
MIPVVPARLEGTAFASGTVLFYVGSLLPTRAHAHHATQVLIAPTGIDLEDDAGERQHARAAVIAPRLRHGHGACAHGALLFLDGDHAASRALARGAEPRSRTWIRDDLDVALPLDPSPEQARALIAAILAALAVPQPPAPRHPAARRMCAALDRSDHADLARLAQEAGLSPRQMRHAFLRDVGLPMRAYLRWKRLRRAIAAVGAGASLSAAAATAGFADGAHLSRVFREQFGIAPSQGLGSVRWRTLD